MIKWIQKCKICRVLWNFESKKIEFCEILNLKNRILWSFEPKNWILWNFGSKRIEFCENLSRKKIELCEIWSSPWYHVTVWIQKIPKLYRDIPQIEFLTFTEQKTFPSTNFCRPFLFFLPDWRFSFLWINKQLKHSLLLVIILWHLMFIGCYW
jgi:hypothetical protein